MTLAAEFAPAAQALRNLYDGSFEAFWEDFRSGRPVLANQVDPLLQNVYATAAAFSADADGTVRLPFSLDTGELVRPRCSPAGSRATRFDWRPHTRGALQGSARSGSTPAAATSTASTSAPSRSARRSSPPAPADALHFELFDGGHRGLARRLPQPPVPGRAACSL